MSNASTSASRITPNRAFDLSNVKIHLETKWWGFYLHLNEDATQLLEDIRDLAAQLLKLFGPELAAPIKAAILLEKYWIKLMDKGNGVKLVSPWISPTMLIPLPEDESNHIDDTTLSWSIFDPDSGQWSDDHKFPANYAEVGPAAAVFGNQLMCVHRGRASDAYLEWTAYDSSQGWTRDQRFPAHLTEAEPALAVFQDKLYCAHRGAGGDSNLYLASFDGRSWSADQRFSLITSTGPALAAFQNRLICVHQGSQGDDRLLWTASSNGSDWSEAAPMTGHHTRSQPALAVFQGRLYCVYRTQADDLAWTTFDGRSWSEPDTVGAICASGASLVVRGTRLYCAYVGPGGDPSVFWCAFDGQAWTDPHRAPFRASDTPALVLYQDSHATKDHVMCIHRGIRT
ncbi:MAG: hypothetical protein ABW123_15680 [Cystobacter sp.]